MKFVSCTKWLRRGVCKQQPDKIALSKEEIAQLLEESKNSKTNDEEDEEIDDSKEDSDEYDMENYDNDEDDGDTTAGLSSIACFASNDDDPYMTIKDEEDDSDSEDFEITPEDNVIVVADVDDDYSSLQFYVYNEKDDECFVHHDIMLPMIPLCVEWIGYDAESSDTGNFVAVGGMSTVIEVWDVDIVDCIEPAFTLGSVKKTKKKTNEKKKSKIAHTSDVLDLAWNASVKNILASGSADSTVILWDISSGKALTRHSQFKDKVQSLQWHPFEPNVLITGCCDKSVRLFDCRTSDTIVKEWTLDGEVEKVIWNHFDPFCCLASADNGSVYCYDARSDSSVWTLSAHPSSAVTGLSLSSSCPGLMVTASVDESLKVWDILDNKPVFICENSVNIGKIYAASLSVDSPFVVCCGGDNKSHDFKVLDLTEMAAVQKKFGGRQLLTVNNSTDSVSSSSELTKPQGSDKYVEMETDATTSAMKVTKLTTKKSKKTKKTKEK